MSVKSSPRRQVDWPLWILGVAVLLSASGFGVVYYMDRYAHSDQAVAQREMQDIEALVQKNPQNPQLRVAAATRYLDNGLLDRAIEQSEEALTIDSNNQAALLVLATAYERNGDLDRAVASLDRVVALNQDNPLAKADPQMQAVQYQLGSLLSKQGKYAEAKAALQLALEMNPSDADAHYALGLVYQMQNEHATAVRELELATRYVPDFAEAYNALAASHTALGQTAEATWARAMALLSQGQPESAEAQLRQLIAQSPQLTQAYLGLGLADEKLGKRDEAIEALQEFLKIAPDDIAARQALGRLSRGQ